MRKFISMLVSLIVIFTAIFPANVVNADSSINLYIISETPSVNKGDVLVIDVVADKMPHIMSFENIGINYEEVSLSYEGSSVSTELPESFAVSIDLVEEGLISISGSDDTVKDSIDATIMDNSGDEVEDISFYSEEPVVLCTLYFRVKAATYDFVSLSFDENAVFINSSYEEIEGVSRQDYNFNITDDVSTDSRIVALKVNGNAVVDFQPDVCEYVITVPKETSELDIEAELGNLNATIDISDTSLAFGENTITIDVTAQDGISVTQYKLLVTRKSSFLQEGANFLDNRGRLFSFVSAPADVVIPDGFKETTTFINNFEVPCYRCEGVKQILIYLFDGESNTSLYFYDEMERNVIPYNSSTTIIRQSAILNVVDVPSDVAIPEDFIPAKFVYAGKEYQGYINPAGEVICYLSNDIGKEMFYSYDYSSQTFIKYKPVDKTPENMYKLLFNICLGIAIIESMAIIFIVYVVRRYRKERINPRPRRV